MNIKKFYSILVLTATLFTSFSFASPKDISYETKTVNKKRANVVTINANSKDLKFDIIKCNDKREGWEPFSSMIKRKKPLVAINGNFFASYEKNEKNIVPYGYIYQNGKMLNSGATLNKGSFAVMKDGTIIVDNAESGAIDFSNVQTMVEAGPLLVKDKKIVYDPKNSGFKEEKINSQVAQRSAIGITANKKVIMLTGVYSTSQLAKAMLDLGCTAATNLDGGASSALYAKGKYITQPGRKLNVVLCVYDRAKKNK